MKIVPFRREQPPAERPVRRLTRWQQLCAAVLIVLITAMLLRLLRPQLFPPFPME